MTPRVSDANLSPVRGLRLAAISVLLFLAGGCNNLISGHWDMVEAIPNKETFAIENAWLKPDGTYSAVTTREGMTVAENGRFKYDGFKLSFRPSTGGERTYNAALVMGKLEILDGSRKVVLQKVD